jgi:transcriptional regulator NrdR
MKCPFCGGTESRVKDSRDIGDAIHRRRECEQCKGRFSTYERVEKFHLVVTKRDQRREEFDRQKLYTGISKACEKRPLPVGEIESAVEEIEQELYRLGRREVQSSVIGEWTRSPIFASPASTVPSAMSKPCLKRSRICSTATKSSHIINNRSVRAMLVIALALRCSLHMDALLGSSQAAAEGGKHFDRDIGVIVQHSAKLPDRQQQGRHIIDRGRCSGAGQIVQQGHLAGNTAGAFLAENFFSSIGIMRLREANMPARDDVKADTGIALRIQDGAGAEFALLATIAKGL